MSDTPRTEAVNQYLRTRRDYTKTDHEVWMNHGIQIERELNAANEKAQRYYEAILKHKSENEHLTKKIHQLYEGAEEQKQTIKELKTAWLKDAQATKIRELESEIEEKRKDVVWLATEKAKLENYVMLLEEAGDALYENSDPTKWDLPEANARKLKEQEAWRKAKEDKL